ncbi:hypothetical protein C0995_007091 [Termitomyces sp. Mi166|nr:hypothetical protein C0995_007091 [Termitomyces sp. Mi166\
MADEKGSVNETFAYDNPSTKIWSSYISHAEKFDKNLVQNCQGNMDSLLVFAGLFSASLTAFIIESYKGLSPNPSNTTNVLLAQIYEQLATMSNASTSFNTRETNLNPKIFIPSAFQAPASVSICNFLWFLSLCFSLVCALAATLIQQWARNYLQATESRLSTPHERARISAYLFHGLERFGMTALVEAVPLLLHISLLLFFLGLVEFLRPVNAAMSNLTLGMLIVFVAFYVAATFLPIFQRDCPYRTPLSCVLWEILKAFRCLRRRQDPKGPAIVVSGDLASTREVEAIQPSSERDERDFKAMTWALQNMRSESEFEAFVQVIPRAVAGPDCSAKLLIHRLHYHEDPSASLGVLIPRLLISCTSGVLDPAVSQRRAATCLAAIWSLSMMTVQEPFKKGRPSKSTLEDIKTVESRIPAIRDFAISASTVIARDLLDTYLDQVGNQSEISLKQLPYRDLESGELLGVGQHLKTLEAILASANEIAVPELFQVISEISTLPRSDHHLNQAGFSLLAGYASSFAGGRTLPYKASETIHRLSLRLDFERCVSTETQRRLVACLDDAFDGKGRTRFPQGIVNILLGMVRVLKDPTCVRKAKAIIKRIKFFPGKDEARRALGVLEVTLPTLDIVSNV